MTRGDRVPFSDSPRFADRRPRGIDAAHALRRLADHLLRKTSIAYRRAAGVKPRRRKAASTPAISVRETCPSAFAIFASIAATEAQRPFAPLLGHRSTSCDLAAQGSSRCSSGNLIAARQANLATRLRLGGYPRALPRFPATTASSDFCGCFRAADLPSSQCSFPDPPPLSAPPCFPRRKSTSAHLLGFTLYDTLAAWSFRDNET